MRYIWRWGAVGVLVAAVFTGASEAASPTDPVVTVAGNGTRGSTGDTGQATEASLNQPRSIFATSDGGFVWAQPFSNTVRKVGPDGIVTTIAGTGAAGFSGDGGPATSAQINFVHAAAPTSDGGYLLADTANTRIRKISAGGTITTVAGTGVAGYSGDGGPATSAQINNPRSIVALSDGGFLIPDAFNHRVRRVSPEGVITTVAGTGVEGFSGDGGLATAAQLSVPFGVSPTADGGFLIVDVGNQRIRKVSADGTIATVAGNGAPGYSGDGGPATAASLFNPHNVAALPDGGFLIADTSSQRIRRVDASGTIETFAGTGVQGFSGEGGPASSAQLSQPKGVGVTSAGDVLVADEQNDRIRFVGRPIVPANVTSPVVSGEPKEGRILAGTPGAWSGTGPTFAYQWNRCDAAGSGCVDIAGATGKAYVLVEADVGSTIRLVVTATNVAGSASATSAPTAVSGEAGEPPANVSSPSISGLARDGETLTVDEGSWTGTPPLSYTYRWQRCNSSGVACVDISGATSKSYVVVGADVGATLRSVVTASNDAASSRYAASVLGQSPRSYWRLGDSGGALVDQQSVANGIYVGGPQQGVAGLLTGDPDSAVTLNGTSQYLEAPASPAWTSPSGFSIEILVRPSVLPADRTIWLTQGLFTGWWLNTDVNGVLRMFIGDGSGWRYNPAGAVLQPGQTYHVVATYDGSAARVYVNGSLVSTGPTVAMSPGGADPLRLGAGPSFVGQYWPGTLDEASFYPAVLSAAEIQEHFAISTTGSAATSAPTAVVVPAAPSNTAPPSISGTAEVGQTLTASAGSWNGTQPITYAYQWRRCNSSGGGCADVAGASQPTYALLAADEGATMRVRVSASNAAGTGSADSAPSALVASDASSGTLTVSVSTGADDGLLRVRDSVSGSYPPSETPTVSTTGQTLTVGRRKIGNFYDILTSLLRFDTSGLPDGATVTSATLEVHVTAKADADNRALQAEWYPASNWPFDAADFSLDSTGSALAGADITGIGTGQVNSFALSGLGSVSTTGFTGVRLHVSGGQPTGDNNVQMAAFEHSAPQARLVLVWTVP